MPAERGRPGRLCQNNWRVGRISVAIALAISIGAASAARAEPKWNLTRSGVLTVIGDQPASVLRDIAIQIEQFRAVVGGLIHDADRPPSVPTIVFVFGQKKSLVPIVPLYSGKPISLAGYLGQADDLNVMALSLEGFEESSAVAFHEYTHLLVQNSVRWMPVWLNEGLAEYYGSYTLIDRGRTATIGRPKPEHILLLREKYLPIAELITVDQSSPMYNEGQRRSIFYAESWAATHYLMNVRPDGQAAINAYVNEVASGQPPADAFRAVFGATPEEFDKELKTYLRRQTFLEQRITLSGKLAVAEPSPPRTMTPGEVEAWVGTAQLRVKRTSEAAPRIERAAMQAPGAPSQLALGLLRLEQEQIPDALDAFEKAAEAAPDDFLTQYVSGVSMLHADPQGSDADRVRALDTLKRAVALNGGSADASAALAYVQMLSPATLADARASIEHAIVLAPGRLSHRLRYADILILQDKLTEARQILTAIAAVKSDATSAKAASARLDTLDDYERRVAERAAQRARMAAAAAVSVPAPETRPAEATATPRPPEGPDVVRPDPTRDRQTGFLLRKVRPGEQRALGLLTRVDCSTENVRFTVDVADRRVVAVAISFADIEFTSFLADKNFAVVCGPHAAPERVFLTWKADGRWGSGVNGTALALEFVPANYAP